MDEAGPCFSFFLENDLRLSEGKERGLRAVSTERGIIAALAIDQRSALRKLFSKATGQAAENIPNESLIQFKEAVSRILTPHASSILLDPEVGLPAAAQRSKSAGLLLAYEKTGYDKAVPGRLPSLLDGFSVNRLKSAGADCIKILLYYSPFSAARINSIKQAWVERIGAECAAVDVPFFLELVSYHDELSEKGIDFARIKPEAVTRSLQEFSAPVYQVDVLKVGVPVNMAFVEGPRVPKLDALYSRKEARVHFRRASDASSLPFIYLSEGVSNETFEDTLTLAAEAGSGFSGVLCGRATWQDGVPAFVSGGLPALEEWLAEDGIRNIRKVNSLLEAAHSWREKFSAISHRAGKV